MLKNLPIFLSDVMINLFSENWLSPLMPLQPPGPEKYHGSEMDRNTNIFPATTPPSSLLSLPCPPTLYDSKQLYRYYKICTIAFLDPHFWIRLFPTFFCISNVFHFLHYLLKSIYLSIRGIYPYLIFSATDWMTTVFPVP